MLETLRKLISRFNRQLQRKESELPGATRSPATSANPPHALITETRKQELIQRYDGKLLLRNEIHLDDEQFLYMLHNEYFTERNGFASTLFSHRCIRCNNNDRKLIAKLPCANCEMTHVYCRNCIMMGRVSTCEKLYEWTGKRFQWKKHKNACTWRGELTHAQNEAAQAVVNAIETETEQLVWAVTGAGKTEILFKGIELALSQGKRVCIATPRADVVRELAPRIQAAFATIKVQGLYGKSRDREGTAQLIIATTHQLIRFKNAFDVIVIDEIDAFPYHNDRTLQFATDRAAKTISSKIYLTATPRRDLHNKLKQNKLRYCFVPIRYHGHPLPVPKAISDYKLAKSLRSYTLPKSFLTWLYKRKNEQRQLLIFVPTIDLANHLLTAISTTLLELNLLTNNEQVASVHAEDPLRERKIEQFRTKNIYALITTTILERGVTFPSIDVAVIQASHQVFDEAALVQIAGRAGRNHQDPSGEVVFIHDGLTDGIARSISSIKKMNNRGRKMLQREVGDD